jgi:AraC family transcriptional activator of mtrCDE
LDARIRFTLNVIAKHKGSTRFDLRETSRSLGVSEAYLLRLFHRELGRTFREYSREIRMLQAAELMRQSPQPSKQIALECGYNDISNFYRDFKTVYAMTPREFRLRELGARARHAAAGE